MYNVQYALLSPTLWHLALQINGNDDALYTDKNENQIFLIYREIQSGAAAKSYMTNGLLIYGEIFSHILIY